MSTRTNLDVKELLGLPDSVRVEHVFLVGSRLWGTNSEFSDCDILIVVDELSSDIPKSQHKGNYDFSVLSQAEFTTRLNAGSLIETLCCLLATDEHCNLNARAGMQFRHRAPNLSVVKQWVASRHIVDLAKAEKFWQKGKRREGYKILQHMIMAEAVIQGLTGKLEVGERQLINASLTLDELQEFVRSGKNDDDWMWLGLEWEVVQRLHRVRLLGVRIKDDRSRAVSDDIDI